MSKYKAVLVCHCQIIELDDNDVPISEPEHLDSKLFQVLDNTKENCIEAIDKIFDDFYNKVVKNETRASMKNFQTAQREERDKKREQQKEEKK